MVMGRMPSVRGGGISARKAMWPNWRSSGGARQDAVMWGWLCGFRPMRLGLLLGGPGLRRTRRKTLRQFVEENVDHWRRVQRQRLAQQQAADHRDAQRPAQFGTESSSERERQPRA